MIGTVASVMFMAAGTVDAELRLPSAAREPDVSGSPGRDSGSYLRLPERKPPPAEPTRIEAPPPQPPRAVAPIDEAEAHSAAASPDEEEGEAYSLEAVATADWMSKTAGGDPEASSSAMPGVVELIGEVDTGAAGLWDNGHVLLHLLYSFGSSPSAMVGDLQTLSNIDDGGTRDDHAFAIWEAWYEHTFPYSNSSFQIGVIDYNAEFYVAEYATVFINGAFGFGVEIGAGPGVSAYPRTALGARLKINPTPNAYFLAAVFDGVPDDPLTYEINREQGSFWAVEAGWSGGEAASDGYYKLGLGAWYLRQEIGYWTGDELPPPEELPLGFQPGDFAEPYQGTAGAYFLAETSIGEKLGLFAKAGLASKENNRYSSFYSGGIHYTGPLPGRENDVLGLGFVRTTQSDDYLAATGTSQELFVSENNLGYFKAETTYELTYSAQIFDWLMIQPDLQYVLYPGMDPNLGNAMVVGMRIQVVY